MLAKAVALVLLALGSRTVVADGNGENVGEPVLPPQHGLIWHLPTCGNKSACHPPCLETVPQIMDYSARQAWSSLWSQSMGPVDTIDIHNEMLAVVSGIVDISLEQLRNASRIYKRAETICLLRNAQKCPTGRDSKPNWALRQRCRQAHDVKIRGKVVYDYLLASLQYWYAMDITKRMIRGFSTSCREINLHDEEDPCHFPPDDYRVVVKPRLEEGQVEF